MSTYPDNTAAAAGLASCHVCYKLAPESRHDCPLCGAALHLRKPDSLQRTAALIVTAALLYIPANIFPIMTTTQLGRVTDSTILGGVVILMHHGSYVIAAVIFGVYYGIVNYAYPMLKNEIDGSAQPAAAATPME